MNQRSMRPAMAPQRASYGPTALLGTNKKGVLKPDSDGYYTLVLGGLDMFNSAGAFYPLASARQVFEASSSLMRRIAGGNCRGEYGHPKKTPGMSTREFVERICVIDEAKVCCHIGSVVLEHGTMKDAQGRPIVGIIGRVKPSGPLGEPLRASLENGQENVCFSVRSLTDDRFERGVMNKHIKTIITWDFVNEPGLSVANKYNSPALEAFDETQVTMDHLVMIQKECQRTGVSLESNGGVSIEDLISDMNWQSTPKSALVLPASAGW